MTPRDIARRHWLELAYTEQQRIDEGREPGIPSDTVSWLREVAHRLIAIDSLPAAERKEDVFDAVGLKGPAAENRPAFEFLMMTVALREFERIPKAKRQVTGAEFVALRLEWPAEVAPDSLKRRIRRAMKSAGAPATEVAWVNALLN